MAPDRASAPTPDTGDCAPAAHAGPGNRFKQLISYHADRAVAELDRAEEAQTDEAHRSHLELYRLHLYQLGWLRAAVTEQAVADRVD